MHKFHYRPGKSAFVALLLGIVGLGTLWFWWITDAGWMTLAFGLLCVAGAGKTLADAMSDTPALTVTREGLRVRRTWGSADEVSWQEVQELSVEVLTLRYMGFIPVSRQETLVIKCDGGLFGSRRLRLSLKLIDMPAGGTAALMALLHQAHVAALGEAGVAMAGAGEHGWGSRSVPSLASKPTAETGDSFDADAALARYLARKDVGSAPEPASSAHPVAPARPVFGRRTQAG